MKNQERDRERERSTHKEIKKEGDKGRGRKFRKVKNKCYVTKE